MHQFRNAKFHKIYLPPATLVPQQYTDIKGLAYLQGVKKVYRVLEQTLTLLTAELYFTLH